MVSIYFLIVIIFPVLFLWGIKQEGVEKKNLLDKTDTGILKGCAACFVVIAHYVTWSYESGLAYNKIVLKVCGQLGGLGVMIFFFVSGYGIYHSYAEKEPCWDFLLYRLRKIYLPYIFIKIVLLFLEILIMRNNVDIGKSLFSIFTVQDWFVQVILCQYLFFFVGWRRSEKRDKRGIIIICFVLDIFLSAIYVYMGYDARWYNALWLFVIGMLLSKYEERVGYYVRKKIWVKMIALSTVFGLSGAVFAMYKGNFWVNFVKPVSGSILCVILVMLLQKIKLNSCVMRWIGKRSLHLYIVHINIWSLIKIDSAIVKFWVSLGVSILLTTILYLLTDYIESKLIRR